MKTLLFWIAVANVITFAVFADSIDANAERRVALVVGNSAYTASNLSLANPLNDAQDMTSALKGLGFEVITVTDATKRKMEIALQQFARLAGDADSALFFYAGHAMQYQGLNYLMPTDAQLEDDVSVKYDMVSLDYVREALERTKGVRIMILDACRNNPLVARLQKVATRSAALTRGLAPVDKTEGMVVAFATAADDVAQDGTGRNSPFTSALLKRLQEPGVEIAIMLRRVASDVNAQTNGRQRPETQISLLSEYYLNQNDRHTWERIKDQEDEAALRDFLLKYALSPLASNAQKLLDQLQTARRKREEEEARIAEEEIRLVEQQKRLAELKRKRDEEDKKRQDFAQKQQEERKRLQDLLQQQAQQAEEDKRQQERRQREQAEAQRQKDAEAQRQQDEQKRQEALRRQQQEEQRRQEALRQQEEQKHIAALPQNQEEPLANVHPMPPTIQPARANLPEQIRQAQTELRRLGCFSGYPDSQLNDATRNAVKALWQRTNKPTTVEVNITDDFIADLKRQRDGACAPAVPTPPQVTIPSHPREDVEREPPHSHTPHKHAEPGQGRPSPAPSAQPAPPPPAAPARVVHPYSIFLPHPQVTAPTR